MHASSFQKLSYVYDYQKNNEVVQGPAFAPPRIREAIWCGSTNYATEKGKELKDPRVQFRWRMFIQYRSKLEVSAKRNNSTFWCKLF